MPWSPKGEFRDDRRFPPSPVPGKGHVSVCKPRPDYLIRWEFVVMLDPEQQSAPVSFSRSVVAPVLAALRSANSRPLKLYSLLNGIEMATWSGSEP